MVAALVGLGLAAVGFPNPTGDSGGLISSADAIRKCLSDPSQWGVFADTGCDGVPFAPLQYVPAIILLEWGALGGQVMAAFSALSTVAFFGVLLMVWRLLRGRGTGLAYAGLVLVLSGPLLYYAASSFGEMLAAAGMVAVIYSLARRAPLAAVIASVWLAGISKDTALPFVLLIAAVVIFSGEGKPRWLEVRGRVLAVAAGAVLAAATVGALNLLRWGTLTNEAYNWDPYTAPLSQVPKSAAGLLASPQGGLVIYWPLASLLILCTIPLVVRGLKRPRGERLSETWPAVAILGMATAQLAVLAWWWAPFGWSAWGPRLALPTVTGLAVLTLWRYGGPITEWLHAARVRIWPFAAMFAVACFSTLASLGALVRPLAVASPAPAPPGICPDIPFSADTIDVYYRCLNYAMWEYEPVILLGIRELPSSLALLAFAVVFTMAVGLLAWMATDSQPREERP